MLCILSSSPRWKSWHSVKCLSVSGIYNILSFSVMVNIGKCCYLFSLIQAEVLAFNVMPECFWDIYYILSFSVMANIGKCCVSFLVNPG